MKMQYFSPLILDASGNITLTASQQGLLEAAGLLSSWEAFLEEAEGFILDTFVVSDPSTWPEGFSLTDENSWDSILDFDKEFIEP